MPLRVAILTNIIPPYREGFYDLVLSDSTLNSHVFCHKTTPVGNIRSIHAKYEDKVTIVPYFAPRGNTIVLQWFPYLSILRNYDIIVTDGNPRHIVQALFASLAKVLGKKVIIWSVADSRNNNWLLGKIRKNWWRMFDYFLMYNQQDVVNLQQIGFSHKTLISINNGLNQAKINEAKQSWDSKRLLKWQREKQIYNSQLVISSGRVLVGKYELAVKAIKIVKESIPTIKWVLVGDGNGLKPLKELAIKEQVIDSIIFLGEIYEEIELAPWFLSSKLYIYPSHIGLSLYHAFGYGLPVVTHNNKQFQGPEFIVFEEGKTGSLFIENDPKDLARKIVYLINNEEVIKKQQQYVLDLVENKYNTQVMYENYKRIISLC